MSRTRFLVSIGIAQKLTWEEVIHCLTDMGSYDLYHFGANLVFAPCFDSLDEFMRTLRGYRKPEEVRMMESRIAEPEYLQTIAMTQPELLRGDDE